MKSVTTIKIKIPKIKEFEQLSKAYTQAVQFISDKGYKNEIINRYELHHLCYYDVKEKFNLPSQFIINANRIASQTLKSVITNKGSKPVFNNQPLPYDKRNSTFHLDCIKLATLNKGKPLKLPLDIPEYYWKYLDWDYQTSNIIKDKKGRYFIHITFSRNININKISNGLQVGVDVGINHIAVTSDRKFFSGAKVKRYRLKYKKLRARLQSKGTRSAQKRLKTISGKERRFKVYWNHVISKQIVSNCNAGTIVLEDLKGIRKIRKGKRYNFWLNGWSFYQLQNFISYKAIQTGIDVIQINPANTSQICSKCGKFGSRNKGYFVCSHCGYSLNADLNASYNLAKHHSKSDGVSASITKPNIQSDEVKGSSRTIATELMDKYPCL